MSSVLRLAGGRVLAPSGGFETRDVHVADGSIVETTAAEAVEIDCRNYAVLPGIVDVHGDAFESELHPRPGVDIDFAIAMKSIDRQLVTNGVTTAFHGLSLSWEPGARSLEAGRRFMTRLSALRPELTADHRVQLRWETFAHDAIGDLADWLAQDDPKPAIAFNDHTTLTLKAIDDRQTGKIAKWAQRTGVSLDEYLDLAKAVGAHAPDVPAKIRQVAELGRRHGAVMLSHDEAGLTDRDGNRALGMSVCEFPLARDVARSAIAAGEPVVMGAPNVIRGGSHTGAISAEDAIRDGLCTVLASDYYYPSLFHAAERLVARGVLPMRDAWRLISTNAAEAMGLGDRGEIEPGRRADLAIVDCSSGWRLVHTIAGGRLASLGR
ncbi:MAG: alpha-D-ribose 1-methylphosphonate 5-triphosphate diphosphatase [Pseudomonadota bacterium]